MTTSGLNAVTVCVTQARSVTSHSGKSAGKTASCLQVRLQRAAQLAFGSGDQDSHGQADWFRSVGSDVEPYLALRCAFNTSAQDERGDARKNDAQHGDEHRLNQIREMQKDCERIRQMPCDQRAVDGKAHERGKVKQIDRDERKGERRLRRREARRA